MRWVIGEQPHRVGLPQRRPIATLGFPFDEPRALADYREREHVPDMTGRTWPCGHTDGGFMFGDGEACRAADVLIEDYVGTPLYTGRPDQMMLVESTHEHTEVLGFNKFGNLCKFHDIHHPGGIR